MDFVTFDPKSSRFQLGPRLNHRLPVAALVHRGEIVVLLHGYQRTADGGTRSEALFMDRNMKKRKPLLFEQGDLGASRRSSSARSEPLGAAA